MQTSPSRSTPQRSCHPPPRRLSDGKIDSTNLSVEARQFQAIWRSGRYIGAMPSVQVKDVPDETHAVLRRRAAAAHQSLQEYLRQRLIEEAATPTVEEVMERAGGRAGGSVSFADAVAALRDDRDRR